MTSQVLMPSPFAAVELQPLQMPNGQASSRSSVVLDPSSQALEVGVVSDDYKLVPNTSVIQIAEELLHDSGHEFSAMETRFTGRRFMRRYRLTNVEGEVKVGDVVALTLDAVNSYDGSTTFGLEFNAVRLVCSNGMMLSFLLGGYRFKHWGDRDFTDEFGHAARKLAKVGTRLHQALPLLTELTSKRMKRVDIQRFFRETALPIITQAKIFNTIDEDTAWGIYNATTDVLTRQESFNADKQNRIASQWFLSGN